MERVGFFGFRKKILLSYLAVILLFAIILYPVNTTLIEKIQKRDLEKRTQQLITLVEQGATLNEMEQILEKKTDTLFFRVTLLAEDGKVLYDSEETTPVVKQEVHTGYEVRYSPFFEQEMAYVAIPFKEKYILRTAFPYQRLHDLTQDLTFTLLILGLAVLLMFSFLAWFIIHHLTRPVRQMIDAIGPYQRGEVEHIPEIHLKKLLAKDEFGQLAATLNSLSRRVEAHLEEIRRERDERNTILESLIEGVVVLDEERRVIYRNTTALKLLNVEEILIDTKLNHSKLDFFLTLLDQAEKISAPTVEVIEIDGKPKRFLNVIAAESAKKGEMLLVLQDQSSLQKVIELGRDFIANASHELKTPITIIQGFAETIHDHPELSVEVHREVTGKIVRNCKRMHTLVKNLLTLAAVDEGIPQSRLRSTELESLCEEARQTTLIVHTDAEIEIKSDPEQSYVLLADSDLLLQAVINLLENACKYSKPPAKIEIGLERGEHVMKIHIKDQGFGIPQEDCERIFERFYAVDKSHSRSLGGSGLGLSIVARIVEKHGGGISIESEVGEGSTFTISLPLSQNMPAD